ncbi:MAG: phosphotransferase [Actinomycetota bacterium]
MSGLGNAALRLVDPALPAARHLVGPDAADVLRPPVEATGGSVVSARPVAVQYRPGSDVLVRYEVVVLDATGRRSVDTIVAASTIHGDYPGAVEVVAPLGDDELRAAVWKWPFDPHVAGLADAVTPTAAARLLGVEESSQVRLTVLAYRPTDRVVVRADHPPVADSTGAPVERSYLKGVRAEAADALVARHRALRDSGVPAAAVRSGGSDLGILVLDELAGPTLRDLVKGHRSADFPDVAEFDGLADVMAPVDVGGGARPAPDLLRDGALHARMLAAVHPASDRLNALADVFVGAAGADGPTSTVHGDLHEAQLVIDDRRIVGVLDVDDAGPGDPADDRANLIGRLVYRAVTNPRHRAIADGYVDVLRSGSARRFDAADLDRRIAAAVVGLATGPFRSQSAGWRDDVEALVTAAEALVARRSRG